MAKIKGMLSKHKSFLMYAVFGVLTTIVNMVVYYFCFNIIEIPNVPSTTIAWVMAVCFAFITNKLCVFDSKSFSAETLKYEIPTFFGARIATGLLDVGIMYLAVDVLHWNSTLWKLISNVLVIIINYVASKFIIFKHPAKQEDSNV